MLNKRSQEVLKKFVGATAKQQESMLIILEIELDNLQELYDTMKKENWKRR